MKYFFKNKSFRVVFIIAVSLIIVIGFSASSNGEAFWAKNVLSYITVPLQKVSSAARNMSQSFFDRLFAYDALNKENEALQHECDSLKKKMLEYDELKRSNISLKELLKIKEQHPDFEFVCASVIGSDSHYGYGKIMIDKGKRNGVEYEDVVMTSSGYVGRVTEVGQNYSVVTTLFHPQFKIGAFSSHDNQLGVVSGDIELAKNGLCKMQYLEEKPKENTIIATAGSKDICPRGLLIGTIQTVTKQKSGTTYVAEIQPVNQLNKLTNVYILVNFEE